MKKETQSAIIGFWRMGAPIEQICHVTNVPYQKVELIIEKYIKLIKGEKQNDVSE